jgi:hypothetical protein
MKKIDYWKKENYDHLIEKYDEDKKLMNRHVGAIIILS